MLNGPSRTGDGSFRVRGSEMPLSPATQATLDQLSALARDAFDEMDVDLTDPDQRRAVTATWYMIAANQHATPYILAAISEAVGTGY